MMVKPPARSYAPPQLINQAITFHQKGMLAEAERLYRTVLRVKPDHFDARHLLGVLRFQQGRYTEALDLIGKALQTSPNAASALSNYGLVLTRLRRFEGALVSFDKAIAIKPEYMEALNNRGNALRELNRFEEALASHDKALAIKPDYIEAHYDRGNTLHALKRFGGALASYDKALNLKPGYVEALNNRGNTLRALRRFADALLSYDRALAINPKFAEALNNRGNTLRDLNRFEDALGSYDKALAMHPTFAEALNNRGNTLRDLNRFEEAMASYRKALAIRPDSVEALSNLGMVLKELGKFAEARWAAERIIEVAPQRASAYRLFGEVNQFVPGDRYVAIMEALARDAASLSVYDQVELHFALAKAYEDLGRLEDSFAQLLVGNSLKRRLIAYDEAASLSTVKHIGEVFTPELIGSLRDVGEPSSIPVFIVGMPRSGTTLVEQVLASHPQVFGAGELKCFSNVVAGRATNNGVQRFRDLVSSMSGEQFRQLGESYVAEIKRLAPSAIRIVDKMPTNYAYVGLIHLALPKAFIIHTVRDPVDTCMSCFSNLFAEANDYSYDLAELGRYYRHYQDLMAHWHRVLPPGRILDVSYEDVVSDLESAARRIVGHCDLDWDVRCLSFNQTKRPVRTVSAAQVRKPIYKSSVGRGRAYEAFLAPLLAELSPGVRTVFEA
jgi:tetratricopeptide (TPR) repeat protein